ncbi:MAG: hypothetical protein DMG06_31025, partial [Acidobacteria bacterium]
TVNPFQSSLKGQTDIVLFRLNPTGSALIYSTYLGGSGSFNGEWAADSTLDNQGNLYVTGGTVSNDFPIVNALQPVLRGSLDAFIAKLKPTGSEMDFSTYLGGSGSDQGIGIAVDVQGNAYVTGITAS